MENPTILELRGNGALLHVYSLLSSDLEFLNETARKYNEELSAAWLDPAFRWKTEVRDILNDTKVISEHRGLLMDGRSFLEVRRFGKRRRKFLMEELLNPNLLFPMVQSNCFDSPIAEKGQTIITESTFGTGSMGRFEVEDFDLGKLQVLLLRLNRNPLEEVVLFNCFNGRPLNCVQDDFLVRSQDFSLNLV